MKTSFKKDASTPDATATEPVNSDRTLATQQTSLAVGHKGLNDMTGEWLAKDRRSPRINVVQKGSAVALLKAFDLCDIVLGKNVKIADEKNAASVVAVTAFKDYQQWLPYGSGQGVVYKTEAQVFENGGTTDYSDQAKADKIYFGPRAHIQFGIKAPKEAEENELNFFPFTFEPAGESWALGLITCASSSWTSCGKELETLRQNNRVIMQGCVFGELELSSAYKKNLSGEWYVPIIKMIKPTDPELREFLLKLSGVAANQSAQA
jgi:hypothetical protein